MKLSLSYLSKFDYVGILLLRIALGALIAFHGFPLFLAGPGEWKEVGRAISLAGIEGFFIIFGLIAAMIQSFGGVFIIIGIFTRLTCILVTVVLGFAAARMLNRGENMIEILLIVQLALVAVALVFIGPGRLSLDRKSG